MRKFFQEATDGTLSMRRLLAFLLAVASVGLFAVALILRLETWAPYAAGGACLVGSILLLLFTTWSDLSNAVKAVKGEE